MSNFEQETELSIGSERKVKFYKISSEGWRTPKYYAAYEENKAKKYAYASCSSSVLLKTEEVDYGEIPKEAVISNAGLQRAEGMALAIMRDARSSTTTT